MTNTPAHDPKNSGKGYGDIKKVNEKENVTAPTKPKDNTEQNPEQKPA